MGRRGVSSWPQHGQASTQRPVDAPELMVPTPVWTGQPARIPATEASLEGSGPAPPQPQDALPVIWSSDEQVGTSVGCQEQAPPNSLSR